MLNRIWKRNRYRITIFIIALIIVVGAINIADIAISSKDVLQSLIQAEATILGFFGIIVTYLLASYDTRLDRLEQQRFDVRKSPDDLKKMEMLDFSYVDLIGTKIENIKQRKRDIAETMGIYTFFLILSLLLSIITLGMIDSNSAYLNFLSVLGLAFFFFGIVGILIGFIQISREP
jgi:hypothetical protein